MPRILRKLFLPLSSLVALACLGLVAPCGAAGAHKNGEPRQKPNVVLILADDLGYGDLGCYGQRLISTPHLDALAKRGVRFTNCYAGSTVCAPSRCALLTGMHMGHARIRTNGGGPLAADDVTLAKVLSSAGYRTQLIGKWGLGDVGTTGTPDRQGFDHYFGYLNQIHAHNYYPDFLWRDGRKVSLANVVERGVATKRVVYSPDLMAAESLTFLARHGSRPFFLYLAFTLPHANNEAGLAGMEVPSDGQYAAETWPPTERHYAAMITRLDAYVGRVCRKLKELGLEKNTLVLFSSDNGPHEESGADPRFFDSTGGLRGMKRSLYDGGIRVPMIAVWPARVPAGATSSQVMAFWDVLPTIAAAVGATSPPSIDGVSMLPALMQPTRAIARPPLYWEFYEGAFAQAARDGKWKAVRPAPEAALELYDLAQDRAEEHDVVAEHPDVAGRMEALLRSSRTPGSLTAPEGGSGSGS